MRPTIEKLKEIIDKGNEQLFDVIQDSGGFYWGVDRDSNGAYHSVFLGFDEDMMSNESVKKIQRNRELPRPFKREEFYQAVERHKKDREMRGDTPYLTIVF